ncbi:MAG: hypothetical protein U0744_12105 [Gemmataceae bacterium]
MELASYFGDKAAGPHGAIEEQIRPNDLDFRSRFLIRDSIHARAADWNANEVDSWIKATPHRAVIERIMEEDFGRIGFHFLHNQIRRGLGVDGSTFSGEPEATGRLRLPTKRDGFKYLLGEM